MWTCSIFLLKFYLRVGPWFKFWETKPIHSAQCRHVVVCTHQIKKTWESLLKTIWAWESQPWKYQTLIIINHTKLRIKLHLLVCQVCCCAGARIIWLFFSTKSCSNACFSLRFVVHQIVLRWVLFLAVCRAPNRAPMRAFFCGLSCTKSCSDAFFFGGLSCTKSCSNACFFFCGL